jgi:hypothetical protein
MATQINSTKLLANNLIEKKIADLLEHIEKLKMIKIPINKIFYLHAGFLLNSFSQKVCTSNALQDLIKSSRTQFFCRWSDT